MNDIDKSIKYYQSWVDYDREYGGDDDVKNYRTDALEALKQQKQGYIDQRIITKALSSGTADGVRLKRLIAKSIESGDLKLIRCGDKLQKQAYMNKLMRDVEGDE